MADYEDNACIETVCGLPEWRQLSAEYQREAEAFALRSLLTRGQSRYRLTHVSLSLSYHPDLVRLTIRSHCPYAFTHQAEGKSWRFIGGAYTKESASPAAR